MKRASSLGRIVSKAANGKSSKWTARSTAAQRSREIIERARVAVDQAQMAVDDARVLIADSKNLAATSKARRHANLRKSLLNS